MIPATSPPGHRAVSVGVDHPSATSASPPPAIAQRAIWATPCSPSALVAAVTRKPRTRSHVNPLQRNSERSNSVSERGHGTAADIDWAAW